MNLDFHARARTCKKRASGKQSLGLRGFPLFAKFDTQTISALNLKHAFRRPLTEGMSGINCQVTNTIRPTNREEREHKVA